MKDFDLEERVNRAVQNFEAGIQISGSGHFRSGSPHQELCNGTENG